VTADDSGGVSRETAVEPRQEGSREVEQWSSGVETEGGELLSVERDEASR
jgi:hypothetical protein